MGAEGLISDKFPGKAAAAAVHTLGSKALGQRFSKCGPEKQQHQHQAETC